MKKEYLYILGGILLIAIVFSVIQIIQASPAIPNPGHGTSALEGDASLNMNSQKIINLATPTAAGDAATMGYADSVAVKYWEVDVTPTAYTGNLGGYSGANAKCVTAFGAGSVMLNYTHILAALNGKAVLIPVMSAAPVRGWVGAGGYAVTWTPGSTGAVALFANSAGGSWWGASIATYGDCLGWTSASASYYGVQLRETGQFDHMTCETATMRLWCAKPISGGVKYWEVNKTPTTYTGNLGGYSGANAKCVTAFGAGSVMLNYTHILAALNGKAVLIPVMSAAPVRGWVGAGGYAVTWVPNSATAVALFAGTTGGSWWGFSGSTYGDCLGWTSVVSTAYGAQLKETGQFDHLTCDVAAGLWCATPK